MRVGALFLALSGAGACVPDVHDRPGRDQAGDAIDLLHEDPSLILGAPASMRLADLVTAADVSDAPSGSPVDFGVAEEDTPYPDYEWHFYREGIDWRWHDGEASPLEKYMQMADPANVASAKAWNHTHRGTGVPNLARWAGLCNGWAGAATAQRPILHAVDARVQGGRAVSCEPGDADCTHFEIGDIDGLLAEIYSDTPFRFIGGRCDTQVIAFDAYGRVDRVKNRLGGNDFTGCQGLNPASLLAVLAQYVRAQGKSVVINYQTASLTGAIWNRPVWGYRVHAFEPIDTTRAVALVGGDTRPDPAAGYVWNAQAKGFARIDLGLLYVKDSEEEGPATEFVSGRDRTREMRLVAVLELDRPADDPRATVLGGEYVVDDAVPGSARLTVPPYLWVAQGTPLENTWTYPAWVEVPHDPYLRASVILGLAELGRAPAP
jgi:hypothetical protein